MAGKNDTQPLDQQKAISGVLALLVAEREDRLNGAGEDRKTEVILAAAGLNATEIALLVGKKYDAVAKTIQRGRKPARRKKKAS